MLEAAKTGPVTLEVAAARALRRSSTTGRSLRKNPPLPECMKKFVANQSLDKSQMKKLEELGYKVPTKDTEMASS